MVQGLSNFNPVKHSDAEIYRKSVNSFILYISDNKVSFGETCPRNITVMTKPCEYVGEIVYPSPRALESNGPVQVHPVDNFPIILPEGRHTRVYTAVSETGQVSICYVNITVQSVRCPYILLSANVRVAYKTCGDRYGSEASFSCSYPYKLEHDRGVDCGKDGQWIGSVPSCLRPTCSGPPVSTPNALLNPTECKETDVPVGTRCTMSCKSGYKMRGYEELVCGASGTWQGNPNTTYCEGLLNIIIH